jgi:multifunctional methyltransferase subunit TRM112
MKLYLHNFLQDNVDGTVNYPLQIVPTEVVNTTVEFNLGLIQSFVRRIDFIALQAACHDLGLEFQIPDDIDALEEPQLQAIHHLLFEIEVVSGELVSSSGRRFPIISGIPDMCPHVGAPPPDDTPADE